MRATVSGYLVHTYVRGCTQARGGPKGTGTTPQRRGRGGAVAGHKVVCGILDFDAALAGVVRVCRCGVNDGRE